LQTGLQQNLAAHKITSSFLCDIFVLVSLKA